MENIEAMLCAYIEGDTRRSGPRQIEKHLQDHPQHRKLIQELSAMRELVRELPRVKAPMELGESLRGKAERSLLLGDTGDAVQHGAHGNRWPQIFAIAAIFLLCASLGLVLYKALGPTMKPAVFTEPVASKLSVIPPADLIASPSMPRTRESLAANVSTEIHQIEPGSPAIGSFGSAAVRLSTALQQQQAVVSTQFNVEAIRRRLLISGYDIAGANASPPVVMVVSSKDLPATNAQVTQFLNGSSGISWKKVPANVEAKSTPATVPSAEVAKQMLTGADDKFNLGRESGAPATQPASDVYVANGLTPQQADALRQSLAVQQNGAEVQVFLQPVSVPATSQPSRGMTAKSAESNLFGAAALPATEPSEAANSGGELAAPTTLPANESAAAQPLVATGGNRVSAGANGVFDANGAAALSDYSQILQPVNAVIVIQPTSAAASMPGSAPQLLPTVRVPAEENSSPATQPAPSTQP